MRRVALLLTLCASLQLMQCRKPEISPQGEHWLRFVQITDIHCLDEESPARVVHLDNLQPSSWYPQEAYTTQVLAATLDVINDHHARDKWPIDFAVITGDMLHNAQKNELDWFLKTMDGGEVLPDSGELDGPQWPGATEDNPNLPFQANGLAREIPWYALMGNHDCLATGVFAIDRRDSNPLNWDSPQLPLLAQLIGLDTASPPATALLPTGNWSPAAIRAAEVPLVSPGPWMIPSDFPAGTVPPDPERHYVSKKEIIDAFFASPSLPLGHGFNPTNDNTWYSVRPRADIPLRIIALDSTNDSPLPMIPQHYGIMSREQFEDFLRPELDKATLAGEFILILTHHPSADFDLPSPVESVNSEEFRKLLALHPNIVAHLCGHTHRNLITQIPGKYPYLEIETSSLLEYPQETRIFDVFYDRITNQVALSFHSISQMENPSRLSMESYQRAMTDRDASGLPATNFSPEFQYLLNSASREGTGFPDEIVDRTPTRTEVENRTPREENVHPWPVNPQLIFPGLPATPGL